MSADMTRPRRGGARLWAAGAVALAACVLAGAPLPAVAADAAAASTADPRPWTGDLDGMRDRKVIRILVPYSKTLFFYDKDRQLGLMHEMGVSLERWANQQAAPAPGQKLRVEFVPVPEDRLVADLAAGLGDVAAGGLDMAADGRAAVDIGGVLEPGGGSVIVTRKRGDPVASLEALSGRDVVLHASNAAYVTLRDLSDRLAAEGRRPIRLVLAPEELQDEDLVQMVDAGLVSVAVVDGYVGEFWRQVLPGIVVNDRLLGGGGTRLAWAVRKDSPQLKRLLEGFLQRNAQTPLAGGASLRKYLGEARLPTNAMASDEMAKFNQAIDLFKKYGAAYDFDHLMMMALGYQESRLNQKARNPYGPVGMMQITPATAAAPVVAIKGIDKDAGRNVEAAAKYLRYIADSYLGDPGIDQTNRTLMAFVGYNAGPRKLNELREAAAKLGLDPNVWFQNVELAAARTMGRKTVEYISNIYKYYTAYRMAVGDPALTRRPAPEGAAEAGAKPAVAGR
jgi:membrane-bound lytic murein transglycosylase MltF